MCLGSKPHLALIQASGIQLKALAFIKLKVFCSTDTQKGWKCKKKTPPANEGFGVFLKCPVDFPSNFTGSLNDPTRVVRRPAVTLSFPLVLNAQSIAKEYIRAVLL